MFSRNVEEFHYPLKFQQLLFAAGVGSVTFPVMLGLTQVGLKSVRISTGSPLILATTVGGISVTLSSLVASLAVVKSYSVCNIFLQKSDRLKSEYDTDIINLTVSDMCVSAVSGMIMYRALGGRFMSILPSHLHKPGAFARQWIPAHSSNYANNTEKRIIKDLGKKYGCHSCGKWRVSQFVADHQPPNKFLKQSNGSGINGLKEGSGNIGSGSSGIVESNLAQRFYPQCNKCSLMQGQSLGSESTASPIITHPFSLRLYHLFLPIPLALPFLKSTVNKHQSTNTLVSNEKLTPEKDGISSAKLNHTNNTEPTSNVSKQETAQQNLSELVINFPLLIVWRNIVTFLDSFPAVGSFHITLWAFSIIAALGTI